jgi:hypothetical protein
MPVLIGAQAALHLVDTGRFKEAMRQVESLTELYFATAEAIPSPFVIAGCMQVALSRGKAT